MSFNNKDLRIVIGMKYIKTNEPRHDKTKHNGFATSMDPDQPVHPVRLQTL
jgi:hypothetical protein